MYRVVTNDNGPDLPVTYSYFIVCDECILTKEVENTFGPVLPRGWKEVIGPGTCNGVKYNALAKQYCPECGRNQV